MTSGTDEVVVAHLTSHTRPVQAFSGAAGLTSPQESGGGDPSDREHDSSVKLSVAANCAAPLNPSRPHKRVRAGLRAPSPLLDF
jgi:hypothetical protein